MRNPIPRARGAALLSALAGVACGVPKPPVAIGPGCDTARVVALDDTVHHVVHAMLAPVDSGDRDRLSAPYVEQVLHSITNSLAVPRRLAAPRSGAALEEIALVREPGSPAPRLVLPEPGVPFGDGYSLATGIVFGLRADGRLVDLAVSGVSSEIELTRALVVAALTTDSLGGMPARPAGADTGVVRLRLALDLAPPPALATRPLFVAALPRRFETLPSPLPGRVARPDFWPRAASPGDEWRAELRVVIDPLGVPIEESIETVAATDSAWAAAAARALARSRYSPASIAGCPVKVRVVQPWTYVVR
jgi:hypothetical protein